MGFLPYDLFPLTLTLTLTLTPTLTRTRTRTRTLTLTRYDLFPRHGRWPDLASRALVYHMTMGCVQEGSKLVSKLVTKYVSKAVAASPYIVPVCLGWGG